MVVRLENWMDPRLAALMEWILHQMEYILLLEGMIGL